MVSRELLPLIYGYDEKVQEEKEPKVMDLLKLPPIREVVQKEIENKTEEEIVSIEEVELTIGTILDLEKDASVYIEKKNSSVVTYGGYNNYQPKEQSDDRSVYFYEFSDLKRKPLVFTKVSVFKKWCDEHNVNVSDYLVKTIRENKVSFIACFTTSNYVAVRETYEELDKAINWKSYHNNNYNYYGGRWSSYDDWD